MKPTKRTTLTNPDTRLSHTLLAVVKNHRLLASAMLLLILCSILLSLLPPLVLERIINQLTAAMPGNPMPVNPPSFQSQSIQPQSVQPQHLGSHLQGPQDIRFLLYPALLYFASLAVSGLFEAAQNAAITVFGQKTTHQLRSQMCEKLSRLPAAYFTANEPGKITSRFVSDVDAVDALFTNGIISMFADACKVVSIILVIFWKSKGLGLLMVLLTPLLFLLTRVFQKRMLKAQLANRDAVGKVNNHIPETIRNIRMIHTLFRQDYMEKHYDDYIQESYRAVEKSNLYDSLYSPIIIFISSCVIALMMLLSAMGGDMQQFFGMSVGTAVAVTAYVGKVFTPLESIGMEIQNIQSAVAGVKRIQEFLDEEEMPSAAASPDTPHHPNAAACPDTLHRPDAPFSPDAQSVPKPSIRFQHVSFSYQPGQPVLEDVSFAIHPGECATLTGRTGAGKSTIFRLLLGLFQPDAGHITICGRNPMTIPDSQKRKLFGYVEQSFHLIPGTIAEQISLFDPSISRAQIEQAARLTGLHEIILALENGYDTPAAENLFSQGQLQLLSIARAIAADPEILLLDEITANLDSDTERRVMDALEQASRNRTVLSISHRLYERTMAGKLISVGKE